MDFFFLQSNLSGFYDPCPEEEKMLKIRYLFRDAEHEVTYGDKEPVRIPKQCKQCIYVLHRINQSICQLLVFLSVETEFFSKIRTSKKHVPINFMCG